MFDTLTASQSTSSGDSLSGQTQQDHLSQFAMSSDTALGGGGPGSYARRQKRKAKRRMKRHHRKNPQDSYHSLSEPDEEVSGGGDEAAEADLTGSTEEAEVEGEGEGEGESGGTDEGGTTASDTATPDGSGDPEDAGDSEDDAGAQAEENSAAPAKVVVDESPGDCKCREENLTGLKSDVQKPTTRERVPGDLLLEEKWDHWINYPAATWDAEKEQVEKYNHAYDQINSQERDQVDNLFDWRQSELDQIADGGEVPDVKVGGGQTVPSSVSKSFTGTGSGPERSDPQWQRDRDKADRDFPMLWGEQGEGAFTGFEGDLSHTRTSPTPVAADWLSPSFTIGEAFGDGYANEGAQKAADYQVPIKNYKIFADKNGKETSLATYGYADGAQPSRRFLSKQYYKELRWCPVKTGEMGVRKHKKAVFAKHSKKKTRLLHRSKVETQYYQQCATWVYRTQSGKYLALPNGPERPLQAKRKEAEAYKAYHEKRLEYLEQMASIPTKNK